ncbi:putative phage protein gp47/JayE [Sphingomonas vulcanisoli]|uniref:Phage protein gp47/JayE n=1 Tax=Sphingomonas vulcanisoli TaxID=1658060 RepID=A0ABX0TP19_9SPHN|nr:baseplate J/gp47 family protein [Sphingomonas vulcanisoli]NIJ07247.1 putative phage protein gp47/JayE [Sphingomonas vulcanisoli]
MPFQRQTLSDLRKQVASDIEADLPSSGGLLRYSNLGIMGNVQAAGLNGLYGYLDWIALQSTPFTATDEYLEAWAALKGITRKPASPSKGSATFSGTNGATIPAGTLVTRADGVAFTTLADATVSLGIATAMLTAVDAGANGNGSVGAAVTLGIGIASISSTGQTGTAFTGGADVEADDSLRSRMLRRYASPPQGGALSDYEGWALDVPGVTRAWARGNLMGAGTVTVYFMMDVTEATHTGFPQGSNGVAVDEVRDTPATGDQLTVANALYPLRPVTALVYAVAPEPNIIDIAVSGLSGASTATKGAVQAAIIASLRFNAVPGGETNISVIELAIAAIPAAAGFVITSITASHGAVSPGAAGNITSDPGHLPILGTVTFP